MLLTAHDCCWFSANKLRICVFFSQGKVAENQCCKRRDTLLDTVLYSQFLSLYKARLVLSPTPRYGRWMGAVIGNNTWIFVSLFMGSSCNIVQFTILQISAVFCHIAGLHLHSSSSRMRVMNRNCHRKYVTCWYWISNSRGQSATLADCQGHCGACRMKWRLTDTDLCPCGETQTMSHIVKSCPLTKLNGGLSRLHSADEDAVSWLTNYG